MSPADDDFDDLSLPSRPGGAGDLASLIAAALGEGPGLLEIVPEDEEMAVLVRDGQRLSRLNLREVGTADPERRARFAAGLAELVRTFDRLHPTIAGLEVGHTYVVDYKHERLRRTFRAKGTLLRASGWRTADGVRGGGWMLTFEVRPRFGKPSELNVDTSILTRVEPA
jgi:hypothetical protein